MAHESKRYPQMEDVFEEEDLKSAKLLQRLATLEQKMGHYQAVVDEAEGNLTRV